ncbi:CopD family protein [Isoptericola halotolerans]|uniref:copper resistance CopC/CopD family protein n=1 Tax=Isoptericola halotolerans TaxID=300560 RepID=UPI00388E4F0A
MHTSARRRVLPAVLVAAAGILLAFLAGGPAAAHAVLEGTDPQDGTVLDTAPEQLTLSFNEPVQAVPEGTTLLSPAGDAVDVQVAATDSSVVITPDDELGQGTWVVSWRVISLDSHPVAGAFSFSVGEPSADTAGATSTDPGARASSTTLAGARTVVQTALFAGTLLGAGLVVFELLVLHVSPGAAPALRRRLQRVRYVALTGAAVAAVLLAPTTTAWQAGGGWGALADPGTWTASATSETAVASAIGLAGLGVATAFAARAGRDQRAAWPAGVSLGAAVLAVGSLALVGHTRTAGPVWLVVPSDVLHVVTAAVWLGGVVGLALVLAPSSPVDPGRAARTVSRFSTLGAWLLVALALTGVVLAWRILGTLDALWTTSYGLALLTKTWAVLYVVLIAAWNHYRLVPLVTRDGGAPAGSHGTGSAGVRRQLRRTVTVEAALLGLVLAVTGVLVSQSPEAPPAEAATTPAAVEVARDLDEGTLRAHVTPARVGVSSVEIELLDADGAPLEPVADPELSATLADPSLGPLERPLVETGPGTYEATIDLPVAGEWVLEVSVRTSKYANPIVEIPVEVTP